MKSFLFPIALMASAAMAQSNSDCAANYIVEACLEGENAKLANCKTGDYNCQCNQWINIVTCFNNCPDDTRKHESEGQREIFCGYASQFPSSTAVVSAASQTSAAAQTTQSTDNNSNPTSSASGSATSTTNSPAANSSNSAADLALNAGGVLAAVAGLAAVVL